MLRERAMDVGSRIAEYRKRHSITQAQLAEKVGVTFQAVSSWERGECKPDLERLSLVAEALDTTIAGLTEDRELLQQNWELRERIFSEEHMYTSLRAAANSLKLTQTSRALPMMREYHEGQTRKGREGVPYINHPLMMASQCMALQIQEDEVLATILLHDVCEDCGVPAEKLNMPESITEAVRLLTFEIRKGETRAEAKARYYREIAGNRIALLVKILDRCNNISSMASGFSQARMRAYIDETEQYVMPLLTTLKNSYPQYYDAAFLLKYQMLSVVESLKWMLSEAAV